jgi:hypothetical protein
LCSSVPCGHVRQGPASRRWPSSPPPILPPGTLAPA